MELRDLGQVRPIYGRWVWPFKHMEEGDFFTVRHEDRAPEEVRNMAHVRGAQMGKTFSVNRAYSEGVTSVTCTSTTPFDRKPKPRASVDYEAMRETLQTCYGRAADDFRWTALDVGQAERCAAPQIEKPGQNTHILKIGQKWTFAVEFDPNGFTMTRVEQGTTLESFTKRKLEAIMA